MIEVEHVSKLYGGAHALNDVSFQVERGEIVGFLGPNGAGKTTTMKIICGFMPPSAGKVSIDGMDILEKPFEAKSRLGYLPESVPLYTVMTVGRFLHFAAEAKGIPHRDRDREVDRVLNACGLESVKKRVIGHLSKGFRQRVGIAQALVGNPPLLILDEPTIGLDPAQILEIRNVIRDLKGGHTVLLSSHILPEVSQLCRRVIIINKGQIVATDTPQNLEASAQKGEHLRVVARAPGSELVRALSEIAGVSAVACEQDDSFRVVVSGGTDVRAAVARTIVDNGWDLLELSRIAMSLEEIFLQIVTGEGEDAEVSA